MANYLHSSQFNLVQYAVYLSTSNLTNYNGVAKIKCFTVFWLPNKVTRFWNKKWPNFFNSRQQSRPNCFYLESRDVQKKHKILSNIWATFTRKFIGKLFQKNPIWSHCSLMKRVVVIFVQHQRLCRWQTLSFLCPWGETPLHLLLQHHWRRRLGRCRQCDQIRQFIGLWATFQSLW